MRQVTQARSGLVVSREPERAPRRVAVFSGHQHFTPTVLAWNKRGKECRICKLVVASPLNEIVLAMPFRNRRPVGHVSLPPATLRHARAEGAGLWVVRFDNEAKCYAISLELVEKVGSLKRSEQSPEWFISLEEFHEIAWQDWQYVTKVVRLDIDTTSASPVQLPLLGAAL